MSLRPHKNDVFIGEDRWITLGDLAGGQARAIPIDPDLAPVMPLIESLETDCVAACCGIHAFSLLPDDIKNAVARLCEADSRKLIVDLASAQTVIGQLPSDTVVSSRINQHFRKDVFLEILVHIRTVIGNTLVN